MTGLLASVVIPTYNRAQALTICLQAVSAQTTDRTLLEVIVVDNNSSDNTREICANFARANPSLKFRYVLEERQGLSHARNRGVAEAAGEVTCFLDDDAPPTPQWLASLLEPFSDPKVGCVGGPACLDYQGMTVPPWLQGDLQSLLSGYGLPFTQPTPVNRWDQFPIGCNMGIRSAVFGDVGLFRTDLGRNGKQASAAEDTEMASRIHAASWKVVYAPAAIVRHLVPPQRLAKSYIYKIGRGLAQSHVDLTADSNPFHVLRWFASDFWYATRLFFMLLLAFAKRKPLWFDDYMRFWMVAHRLPIRFISILGQQQIVTVTGGQQM